MIGALVLAASLVACSGDASEGAEDSNGELTGDNPVRLGPDGMPVGEDGKPLSTKLDGKYELASAIDLTATGLLPDTVNDTLKALSSFREKPTQTFIDLADAANVPFVPLINAVPEVIRGFVFGYIDDHIFEALYDNVPVTKTISTMIDDLASIVTKFQLVTNLDLPEGDGIGNSKAKHTIVGVGYNWNDKLHVISTPSLVGKISQQSVDANAVALERRSPQLESGRLKVEAHTFGVPIGSFATAAADELAKDKFGADGLRGALGKVVDCDKLADAVSKRCIDPIGPGKICVDHKSEIKKACTVGLDLIVDALKETIQKLDIPVLGFNEGVAQMWDAPTEGGSLDAVVDRIDHGFWSASIRVGKEDKTLLSTFSGHRVGESSQPSQRVTPPR
jgi:hypothetical protein